MIYLSLLLGIILMIINIAFFEKFMWIYGLWWYPIILMIIPIVLILLNILDNINKKYNGNFKILRWCGLYSFELYLFHERIYRVFQIGFEYFKIENYNVIINYVFILSCFFIAYIYNKFINYIQKKYVKKEEEILLKGRER